MNEGEESVWAEEFDSAWSLYERFWLEKPPSLEGEEGKFSLSRERMELIQRILKLNRLNLSKKLTAASEILEEAAEALRSGGFSVFSVDGELVWRGLPGSSSGLGSWVLEVGVSWDPILDLPVIPGSGIKGAARSFLEEYLKKRGGQLGKNVGERILKILFGEREGLGRARFLDALPVSCDGKMLAEDVVNPHYNLQVRPIEREIDVRPNPVIHLALAPGLRFRFVVGVDEVEVEELGEASGLFPEEVGENLGSIAAFSLGGALRLGLGSRVLKGYGIFRIVDGDGNVKSEEG